MDILDSSLQNEDEIVNLDELVPTVTPQLPLAAARNRAATTAMLSDDPEKAVENYRLMLHEASTGSNEFQKQLESNTQANVNKADMKGMMNILSDPRIPVEQKQEAIKGFNTNSLLQDNNTTLLTNSLTAHSVDEPREQEDARINTVDSIRRVYQASQDIQGIRNLHGASLDSASASTFFEMLETWVMPFGNNVNAAKLAIAQAEKDGRKLSNWEKMKLYVLPGTATASLADRLAQIPPEQRAAFAKSLVDTISANSGIVFSNNNQFAQFDKANAILQEGGYGSFEEFVDNVSPLLDLIGVGQMLRGGAKAVKARGVVGAVKEGFTPRLGALESMLKGPTPPLVSEPTVEVKASGKAPPSGNIFEDTRTRVGTPEIPEPTRELDSLFEERAAILGDSGQLLERGAVAELKAELEVLEAPSKEGIKDRTKELQKDEKLSFKEAQKKATKEYEDKKADYEATKNRLETQIDYNALSQKNEARLAELDKKIAELQKAKPKSGPAAFNPIMDAINRISLNSFVRIEHPSAPASVVQQANPSQARAIHAAVFGSESDELAEGLHGVNKTQAIVNDTMPQVTTASGAVTSKTPNIQKNLLEKVIEDIKDVIDMIDNTGAIHLTRGEKAIARSNIVNDFKNAEGLTMNEAMSSFTVDGGKIKIDAVYGLAEGSFLKAEDAIAQAKMALRHYGILDDEIEILRKEGLDHVPVDMGSELQVDGNFLVRVKTSSEIDPTDVGRLESLDVKRNLFDRISPWLGKFITSPTRWMFDAASMLHPTITSAASRASDRASVLEKILLDKADSFARELKKFDKVRRDKIDEYIKEANYNGVAYDRVDLSARGFNPEEIDALKLWRDFWDAHYYLENLDVVRSLNAHGYELFKNQNTELYVKPIGKNQNIVHVYDPATDAVEVITKPEMDILYAAGGTLAKLRRPTTFGADTVEHMIVRNTPSEYTRKFRHTDTVLNHRPGYFQIQYTAPKFVDELIKDTKGVVTGRRTIAVGGDTAEAETFAKRMAATQGVADWKELYRVRGDARAMPRSGDEWWDLNSAAGRISQRHRGKLLEDSSGLNHLGDGSYIINPVDSAIRAARSISGRTVSRPMLETAKARAITQYSDMFPSDGMGGRRWPKNLDEITAEGEHTTKRLADARTTYEYINYLENGYINNIDVAFKATLNMVADLSAKFGLSRAERAATKVGDIQPTSLAKNTVFMSYIGSNIFRQWIVQPHQVVRTFAYNPMGWATGAISKLAAEYTGDIIGLTNKTDFSAFVKESGLLASVDKQNLVRGALMDAADATNPATKGVKKTAELMRRIGFDVGESANQLGHLAAVYDRYKRIGKDLTDKVVRDEAVAEARALSYEMNFAGDMPYNQTTPSVLLQFLQVPHKAMLQMTNRKLPREMRARLLVADLIMWGPPSVLISDMLGVDFLPDNPKLREVYLYGMESMLLNNMFNQFIEEDTSLDFSGLDPYDMRGWGKFFHAMYSGGMSEMVLNSPAGQLFMKDQGRTQNAIAAMQRYFAGFIDPEQPPETFLGMMKEVAKISSGFNSAHKAKMLLDAKQRYDQYGVTIDKSINHVEAWAQLFGFSTQDTAALYEISNKVSTKNKEYREEVLNVYKTMKQYYAKELESGNQDPRFITSVSGFILNRYKDEPIAMDILAKELKRDLADREDTLLYQMLKASGIPDYPTLKMDIERSPLPEDQKRDVIKRLTDTRNARTNKDE